ncbi:hypothetical protein NDU88_006334 [Pleurodeles waltl]|uniref:Uncharacterized protein n=1 Tax=Pleurodeles waltl TaxID=8319 RepID=A0AAV7PI08_PLEWA|nr:hypothetical protein NDU88_006334 [Pleurodeles waltl]
MNAAAWFSWVWEPERRGEHSLSAPSKSCASRPPNVTLLPGEGKIQSVAHRGAEGHSALSAPPPPVVGKRARRLSLSILEGKREVRETLLAIGSPSVLPRHNPA